MNEKSIISLISRIRYKANKLIIQELANHGITGIAPSHGDILVHLFRKDTLTMTELADAINRKKNTVTTLIEKLMKLGFIKKTCDENDNRISHITLTPEGARLKPCFYGISDKLLSKTYQGITHEERKILMNILLRIHKNLE